MIFVERGMSLGILIFTIGVIAFGYFMNRSRRLAKG